MIVGLTACGGNSTETDKADETEAPVTAEVETVKVMTFNPSTDEGFALLEAQKELFEEMYPGTTLEIITGTMSVEDGSLVTMLNSGEDLPDVIHINAGYSRVGALAEAGLIRELDDLYEENDWEDKLNEAAVDLCSYVDGKLYEVPTDMDSISCYYNKEIFEELNLEVPETWDDFLNICEVTKEAGYEPIALGAMDGYAVGWSFGNILQSVAGTEGARELCASEVKWTEEAGLAALTEFDSWVKNGYFDSVSTTRGEADAVYAFLNEKTAMYIVGAWVVTDVYSNNMQDKLGTFALPSQIGEVACATGGLGRTYAVPSGVEDTKGAVMWFDFVLSEEFAQMMAEDETNNCIYASKAFFEIESKSPLLQAAKEAVSGVAGRNPSVFIGTETKNAYFQNLQGIVAGIVTPEEAAANIQEGQDKDLAEE